MNVLYLRNKGTGEIHRAYKDESGNFSMEQCNQDDIKDAQEVTEAQWLDAGEKRCGHCSPANEVSNAKEE